jgi:hypothetical protein
MSTLTQTAKPRVLVFGRHRYFPDFRANVHPLSADFDFSFLTDGYCRGSPDTREAFYSALRRRTRCTELADETIEEVVHRCRLLRNIERGQAEAMAHAMAVTIGAALDRLEPRVVLCHWVDEYVTHLLSILTARRHIRFVSYAQSFFPGLVQLTQTAYGEALDVREPTSAEVVAVRVQITQSGFRQNYSQKRRHTLAGHLRSMLRYAAKRAVFRIKSSVERDPWNLHYAVTSFVADRRRLSEYPSEKDFDGRWRSSLAQRRAGFSQPVIYAPLAYVPESAIDYWVCNRRIIDYEPQLFRILRTLVGAGLTIAVKEHVHMVGARQRQFYQEFRSIEGVISVPPMEDSNEVLSLCDGVLLAGGSVGVEATVRGKPVFSFCDTSYWFTASGAIFLDLNQVPDWPPKILHGIATYHPMNAARVDAFLNQCLRSTLRLGKFGRDWPLIDPDDLRKLLSFAAIDHFPTSHHPPLLTA